MSTSPSNVLRLLANGPVSEGPGLECVGTEGLRRAAEWERQIETLDRTEMELHQTQAKLAREQTQVMMRDLASLRQEVAALKQWQEQSISESDAKHRDLLTVLEKDSREREGAHQRLAADVERRMSLHKKSAEDLALQHAENLSKVHDAMGQWDYHHGSTNQRLDNLAKDVEILVATRMAIVDASLKELRAAIGMGGKGMEKDSQAQHASIADRMAYLERALGDSADRHQKDFEAAQKKLDLLHGHIAEHRAQLTAHATMEERMNYIEQILGDSADRHAKELAAAHARIQEMHSKVGELHKDRALREQHHATFQERLDYLERSLGDSADRHAAELASLKAAHDKHTGAAAKHAKDLDAVRAAQADHHGTVAERLAALEKQVSLATERSAGEAQALQLAHEQMHGRLSACEAQGVSLSKSHAALAGEKKALAANHAMLKDRLDQVEAVHAEAAHKHALELDALKGAHEKHGAASGKLAKDLDTLRAAQAQHAPIADRVAYLESLLGDSADKHNQELAAAHAKIEQMHGRLAACEKFGGSIEELRKSHGDLSKQKGDLLAHHATVQERLKYIEGLIGDSADRHAAEVARVRAAHDKHLDALARHAKDLEAVKLAQAHHATMEERLGYLEGLLGESADRHGAELAAAAGKLEQLQGRVAACERHGASIDHLHKAHSELKADKAAADAHHATVTERVGYLEKLLGDSADKHAKEVKGLKEAHAKHASEVEGLRDLRLHHATIEERLNFVEKTIGDSADRHAQELAAAHAKLDQLHGRLGACEAGAAAVGDLKKSHSGLASEKAALEAHHASLQERVDYLENMLGDSVVRHTKMIEAAHSKIDQVHGRLAACERSGQDLGDLRKAHGDHCAALEARHASVQERMAYLEQVLGDSADKHGQELEALRAAHDKHLTSLSKHAKEVEALKAASAHHASFAERLDYLEQLLGDSADRHAAELAALHQKAELLHGKLAEERELREKHHGSIRDLFTKEKGERDLHHASVAERVAYLEKVLGDNADRHAKDLAEARAAAAKLLAVDAKARDEQHNSVAERLERLERGLAGAASKTADDVRLLHSKLDTVFTRVAVVQNAWGTDTPPPTAVRRQ